MCNFSFPQDLNQYILLETLDILGDLIHRYGGAYLCTCVHVFMHVYSDICDSSCTEQG